MYFGTFYPEPRTLLPIKNLQYKYLNITAPETFHDRYAEDKTGPNCKALNGVLHTETLQRERAHSSLHLLRVEKASFIRQKIVAHRGFVKEILPMSPDSTVKEHFPLTKTLMQLEAFHWKGKFKDLKAYYDGCQVFH